jgi:hypothetical protein
MKILILFLISFSVFAQEDFFKSHNIILKSEDIPQEYLDDFIVQFKKFPESLMQEMLTRNAKIHLIEGQGVTDDPTWGSSSNTFDGRSWSDVPGAGGNPRWNKPTRIVVNRLHEGHGSVNLFLHEHGHALDSTYKTDGASNSKSWKAILKLSHVQEYLKTICKKDYCLIPREAFAETFARFHESEDLKAEIIEKAPEIAALFNSLTTIKTLK